MDPPRGLRIVRPAGGRHLLLTAHLPYVFTELDMASQAYIGRRCIDHLASYAGNERVRQSFDLAQFAESGTPAASAESSGKIACAVFGATSTMLIIHFAWQDAALVEV